MTDTPSSGNPSSNPSGSLSGTAAATDLWLLYQDAQSRSHWRYCRQAWLNEQFYLGGQVDASGTQLQGGQWLDSDRHALAAAGRPCLEVNLIAPAVHVALGHQLMNRVDIAYQPRGGAADDATAAVLSRIAMQVVASNQLRWKESRIYADGLILQRGYYDVRMDFHDNVEGEIRIEIEDPFDVLPDPDACGYDPAEWGYVLVSKWMSLEQIRAHYGDAAALAVAAEGQAAANVDPVAPPRAGFGGPTGAGWMCQSVLMRGLQQLHRVVQCQRWETRRERCLILPEGTVIPWPDDQAGMDYALTCQGAVERTLPRRRVRWTTATQANCLFDEISPYRGFTVIPYFAHFRRGTTRGLVDAAIDPQRMYNKALSGVLHTVNTMANSGWMVEAESLTNMTLDGLTEMGARTGLVVEYAKGATPPQKIPPNPVPAGLAEIALRAEQAVRTTTAVSESLAGTESPGASGVAVQSRQWSSQHALAVPLDNLGRTRFLLARRILELIQDYYTAPRILRLTDGDATGLPVTRSVAVNSIDAATGRILHDLTVGEYDVVIGEQPLQATFEQAQLKEALEMRRIGVRIPDDILIRNSTLHGKSEIVARLAAANGAACPNGDACHNGATCPNGDAPSDTGDRPAPEDDASPQTVWKARSTGAPIPHPVAPTAPEARHQHAPP